MTNETAEQIQQRFNELGVEIDQADITKRMDDLMIRFKVPAQEAQRSVVSFFLREHDIKREDYYGTQGDSQTTLINDITESGQWVSLRAKVTKLWDSEHESIDQIGLIGDETGTIKFVKWAKSELPPLEEGKSYSFENLITDEYAERFSVKLNRNAKITEIEDIEVGHTTTEFTGAMVHIQDGSGLIKRCEVCNRTLWKGACQEHGNVDGVYDLRIKAVIDDGLTNQSVLFNRELTEELTKITLDDAKKMAMDALDQSVVVEAMKTMLVGRYYTVTGGILDRFMLVESVRPADALTVEVD